MVVQNDKNESVVTVHNCRSTWSGMAVLHQKEYREPNAEGANIGLDVTDDPVRSVLPYRSLVKGVELYQDGRMMQGDASALSKGGWSLKLSEGEAVRAIATAVTLEDKVLSLPTNVDGHLDPESGRLN